MRQTSGRENGNLLPTSNGVHDVDAGDAGLDHLLRIDTRVRVDGLPLDVQEVLGQDGRALVDGLAGTVEDAAQHVLRDRGTKNVSGELADGVLGVDARGALEHLTNIKKRKFQTDDLSCKIEHNNKYNVHTYLNDGLRTRDFQDLPRAFGSISKVQIDDFGELRELDIVQDDQRSVHTGNGLVI